MWIMCRNVLLKIEGKTPGFRSTVFWNQATGYWFAQVILGCCLGHSKHQNSAKYRYLSFMGTLYIAYVYIYIWVNYNDLTTTSLEIMVSKGNHPQMALIQKDLRLEPSSGGIRLPMIVKPIEPWHLFGKCHQSWSICFLILRSTECKETDWSDRDTISCWMKSHMRKKKIPDSSMVFRRVVKEPHVTCTCMDVSHVFKTSILETGLQWFAMWFHHFMRLIPRFCFGMWQTELTIWDLTNRTGYMTLTVSTSQSKSKDWMHSTV